MFWVLFLGNYVASLTFIVIHITCKYDRKRKFISGLFCWQFSNNKTGVYALDLKKTIALIEKLRAEINELYENKEKIDEEVLRKSQELDQLLIKYNELLKNMD